MQVTAVIPAYNEAASLAVTLASLRAQTLPLTRILVMDDGSTDATAAVANEAGAEVLSLIPNRGKAASLNAGLATVETPFVLTVDADTQLAPDVLTLLHAAMDDPDVGVACASVLPHAQETLWERGRFLEYILGQTIHKSGQHRLRSVLVAAGCCSLYRTDLLRQVGGFRNATMTEDMDTAWLLYAQGARTAYVAQARCLTMEPRTCQTYLRQLDRWYCGMFQCMALHRFRSVWPLKCLVYWYLADALLAPVGIGLFVWWGTQSLVQSIGTSVLFDVGMACVVAMCAEPRCALEVVRALPAYLIVRQVNLYAYLRAFWRERICGDRLTIWSKGH